MSADPVARALAARVRRTAQKSANTLALIRAVRSNGFFPRPGLTLPVNDRPTLTVGVAGAVSAIDGASQDNPRIARSDPRLTYVSGVPQLFGPNFPRNRFFMSRGAFYGWGDAAGTVPLRGTAYFAYEFVHSGSQFEIPTLGNGNSGVNLRVIVNGADGGAVSVPNNDGSGRLVRVQFPAAGQRMIRIETAGVPCNGIHVAAGAEIAATGRTYPLVTIVGDSFLEGSGAEVGDITATVIARALGLNCALAAVGGSGIVNPGGNNTSGFPKAAFHDPNRIADLTLAGAVSAHPGVTPVPALGLLFASVNDQGLTPAVYSAFGVTLQAAINNRLHAIIDAWTAARAGRPLVLMGPVWPSGAPNHRPPLDIYRVRDAMAEAAWSRAVENVWFIDRLAQPRREGTYSTPTDQAALYTGGASGTDPTHPTPAGHRHDGLSDAAQLRRLILTEFG